MPAPYESGDGLLALLAETGLRIDVENVFVRKFPRGYRFGPHRHDFAELNYVREGSGYLSFGGRIVHLRTGDCAVIFPGYSHYFEASPNTGISLVQLSFSLTGMPEERPGERVDLSFLARFRSPGAPCVKFPSRQDIPDCIAAIGREINENRPRKAALIRVKMIELLLLLSREWLLPDVPATGVHPAAAAARLLQERYDTAVDFADIAARCGLGERGLRKAFVKAYGVAPLRYLTALRLRKAEILLAETGLSAADVAAESGFSSLPYFSRLFSREMGVSPREYRRLVSRAKRDLNIHWTYEGSEKYKKSIPPGSFVGLDIPPEVLE